MPESEVRAPDCDARATNPAPVPSSDAPRTHVWSDPLHPSPLVRRFTKIGRNEKCVCGSGRKWKHCCLHRPTFERVSEWLQEVRARPSAKALAYARQDMQAWCKRRAEAEKEDARRVASERLCAQMERERKQKRHSLLALNMMRRAMGIGRP